MPLTHVFVVQTKTADSELVHVFTSLHSAYKSIQAAVPVEVFLQHYTVVANDLCDRRSIAEEKPYLFAWNADKSWTAKISRHAVLHDEEQTHDSQASCLLDVVSHLNPFHRG